VRTADNQRRIRMEEIARLRRQGKGEQEAERCVLSTRVSSVRQALDGNRVRQTERLVRFGFRYLEQAFRWKGVRLEVLDPLKQGPTEALVQDSTPSMGTGRAARTEVRHGTSHTHDEAAP
jgi:hypothetical protein